MITVVVAKATILMSKAKRSLPGGEARTPGNLRGTERPGRLGGPCGSLRACGLADALGSRRLRSTRHPARAVPQPDSNSSAGSKACTSAARQRSIGTAFDITLRSALSYSSTDGRPVRCLRGSPSDSQPATTDSACSTNRRTRRFESLVFNVNLTDRLCPSPKGQSWSY
jgi:hypothetical protein